MADPALDAKYRVFAVLWALCILFDGSNRGLATTAFTALTAAAALLVVLWPRSTAALATVSAAYVANLAWLRPDPLMVHWYFDGLVSLVIAGAWVGRAIGGRSARVAPADLLRAFAPQARALVLLALGFAGLAKLNTMFLDPDRSCAVALYLLQARVPGYDLLLPDARWARTVAIGLAVATEVGVPFAVLVRRLRPFALVLAATFVFLLGINPVGLLYEFSGPMLALLFLFTADDLPLRVGRTFARLPPAPRWLRPALSAAAVVVALGAASLGDDAPAAYQRAVGWRALWWVGVPGLVALYLAHLPPVSDRLPLRALFRGGQPLLWLVPAAMLANEGVVYLGFPHNTTFTMASDVRMLSGRNNHLLLRPPPLPGNATVEVLDSSVPYLRGVRKRNARINLLTLRDVLASNPDGRARFRVDGGPPEHVVRAGDDPRFRSPPLFGGWLRYAHQPAEERCQHWRGLEAP